MKVIYEIISIIEESIRDDADNNLTDGNIIKPGYNQEIDIKRDILEKGYIWISEYQKKLVDQTRISLLKIKFTGPQGYFIEIPKTQLSKVPEYFIQKQGLLQVLRYTTQELLDFEKKLISAQETVNKLEYSQFINIRNSILLHYKNIYDISRKVSYIDFLSNGAYISLKQRYITPKIGPIFALDIESGRHPVIENVEKDFVSNDLKCTNLDFIHTISGPNMGGKSTFLRQNALLILMAHMGYDIPARNAIIPLIDKIFSRVGSGDNLYLGQSTFMVEMQEVSFILHHATKRSFIIIDEIGRGTSTFDGLSLAWAILEYIHNKICAKTLFATHYHEIIDYSLQLKHVSNWSVAVGENHENIVFLRKIIPGGMKKSYGIEVARLAGLQEEIILEAKKCMKHLESSSVSQQSLFTFIEPTQGDKQKIFSEEELEYLKIISNKNLNDITPIQGLQLLSEIQEKLKNNKKLE